MRHHLNNLQAAFRRVFMRSSYIALAGVLAILAFLLAVWFPNLGLIGEEFGILSVALLFISLLLISKNIAEPIACPLARTMNAQQP